jgi:hypothetical protein
MDAVWVLVRVLSYAPCELLLVQRGLTGGVTGTGVAVAGRKERRTTMLGEERGKGAVSADLELTELLQRPRVEVGGAMSQFQL